MSFVMRDSYPILADYSRNGAPVKGHQVWDNSDAKHSSICCLGEKLSRGGPPHLDSNNG